MNNNDFEALKKEGYLKYDIKKYEFREKIKKIFNFENLENLHSTVIGCTDVGYVKFESDQATHFHKHFYNSEYLTEFLELYTKFVQEQIAPLLIGEKTIVFQKKTNF